MTDLRADEIARRFEERRLADEAAAPDLSALLARPPRARTAQVRAIPRLAFGASALAAAVVVVFVLRTVSPRHAGSSASSGLPPAAIALARWEAPTDVFLQTPGSDLWTSVPDLASAPALESAISPETTKGVER